jgi:hypothetical protein
VDTRCPGSLFKSRACFTRKALGAPASALHDIFHSDLPESFCRPVLGVAKRFLQLLYCASSRRMNEIGLAGQSVVHEGDEGLVYRPLSILSYLGPSKSNFQSTTLRSGMSALMSSKIASPVSILSSTMKMSALGPRPSVSAT